MNLHQDYDDDYAFSDYSLEEDKHELSHKRHIRRMLEDKLERRRLRQELNELDELDGEFDWDDLSR